MIELQNVSKVYHNNGVSTIGLSNISLKLSRGEIIAITGESGSGKSTLLNVISKIDSFDDGEILYKGNATAYFDVYDMDDFRKNKVGFIFQNYNILDSYTVLENVMLPLILKGYSEEDAKKEASILIEKVGLAGRSSSRGSKLSGGEKQRCVIARALASDCEILACDEPTGNLDSETAKEIIKLIMEVAENKLVLIVTHNFNEVKEFCTRELVVADGRIVEDISLKDIEKEDEKEELSLDYVPLNKKTTTHIAKNNVFYTPNKSILMFLLIAIISFAFLYSIFSVSQALGYDFFNYRFSNPYNNYAFVYNNKLKSFDKSLVSSYDARINSFSEQEYNQIYVGDFNDYVLYIEKIPSLSITKGELPKNDNEFVLCVDATYGFDLSEAYDAIGKKLTISNGDDNIETEFVLTGVATDVSLSSVCSVTCCDKLRIALNALSSNITCSYEYLDETHKTDIEYVNSGSTKVIFPKSYEEYKDSLNAKFRVLNTYSCSATNIEFSDDVSEPVLKVSLTEDLPINAFFAFINVNELNINLIKQDLFSKGLSVTYPSSDGEDSGIEALIYEITAFIVVLNLGLYLVGIFFISYFVLSKIYQSRTKDYEIIRTLGVTRKDMRVIVNKEVMIIGFTAIIFSAIVFLLLKYTTQLFGTMEINLLGFIYYFIAMTLFVWFTAKRFNIKLFKFTVRQSIKGDI